VRSRCTYGGSVLPALALVSLLFVGACASPEPVRPVETPPVAPEPPPPPPPKPAPPPPPPPKPAVEALPREAPRNLGADELAKGIRSYDEGDYEAANKQLRAALDLGLATPPERASAYKYLAFMACAGKRITACRAEFRRALDADPAFDLTPAERGHPSWGRVFRSVKAEVAAAAKSEKAKADAAKPGKAAPAPSSAPVPKAGSKPVSKPASPPPSKPASKPVPPSANPPAG